MGFEQICPPSVMCCDLGDHWTVNVLGPAGLSLRGATSWHQEEGLDYGYLKVYRALAEGRELEMTWERPAALNIEDGDAVVRWPPSDQVRAHISARYHVVPRDMAVEATFKAEFEADYRAFELFIASYFTPYHIPRFALQDTRVHPRDRVRWYETTWLSQENDTAWLRDDEALKIFRDGRWTTGFPLNWQFGTHHALPLMTQRHRWTPSIILMAKPQDCLGLSGFNGYHNSQYFHLFGRDAARGTTLTATVRMVVSREKDHLDELAVRLYDQWAGSESG